MTTSTGSPDHSVETEAVARLASDLAEVLQAYRPGVGSPQESVRDEIEAWVAQRPHAVLKSGPPAHVTASCLVLDPGLTQVLLTHHRRARAWYQFGGHLEPTDAGVRAAAAREAAEESGLAGLAVTAAPVQLDIHTLHGDFGRCERHLDVRYAAVAPPGARPAVSAESLDVRWWPIDALPPETAHELAPLVEAARIVLSQ